MSAGHSEAVLFDRRPVAPVLVVAAIIVSASAAALVSPALAPVALATAAGLFATGVRLRWDGATLMSVAVVLLLTLPARQVLGPLGGVGSPGVMMAAGLGAVWLVLRVLPGATRVRSMDPVRVTLALIATTTMVSYVAAFGQARTPAEVSAADRGIIWTVALLGMALVAADEIPDRDRLDGVLRVAVFAGAIMALTGIIQFFSGFDVSRVPLPVLSPIDELAGIHSRSTFRRVAGTASHPIEYGVVMALLLPIGVHLLRFEQRRTRRRLLLAALVPIAVAMPMSLSRSAFVVAGISFAILFVSWPRNVKATALKAAAVFAVMMKVAVPGLLGTVRSLFMNVGVDPSIEGRTNDFELVGELFAKSPLVGSGFRTFLPSEYFFLDNQWFMSLLETGILGTLALLLTLVAAIGTAVSLRRRCTDERTRDLALTLAAALVGAVLAFGTFDALSFQQAALFTFLLIGLTSALARIEGARDAA